MSQISEHNEQELLLLLAKKDTTALSILFNSYYASLMFFTQRYVSFESAQEIVSDAFYKFWKLNIEVSTKGAIYQWLKTTVRNAAINQLKLEKRLDENLERLKQQLENKYEAAFCEAGIEAELFAKIAEAIERLPNQQKTIVKMFFLENIDNSAIAHKLNISVQAVKNQKVNALKSLRKVFNTSDLLQMLILVRSVF